MYPWEIAILTVFTTLGVMFLFWLVWRMILRSQEPNFVMVNPPHVVTSPPDDIELGTLNAAGRPIITERWI